MTRETPEQPMKPVKPQTRTRENRTRKMWGKGLTGTGTGWPGIPQGYPWYTLIKRRLMQRRLNRLKTNQLRVKKKVHRYARRSKRCRYVREKRQKVNVCAEEWMVLVQEDENEVEE